jgi:hypothetical protein
MADTLLREIIAELEKVTDALGVLGTAAMQPMPARDRAVLYVRLADARMELEWIRDWIGKPAVAEASEEAASNGEARETEAVTM